ncbi:MAG: hypothetical protein QXI16_00175 [Sulfolobaceae archaeon]
MKIKYVVYTEENVIAELKNAVAKKCKSLQIKTNDTWITLYEPLTEGIKVSKSFYNVLIDNKNIDYYFLISIKSIQSIKYEVDSEEFNIVFKDEQSTDYSASSNAKHCLEGEENDN